MVKETLKSNTSKSTIDTYNSNSLDWPNTEQTQAQPEAVASPGLQTLPPLERVIEWQVSMHFNFKFFNLQNLLKSDVMYSCIMYSDKCIYME